ncbi:hypothetical protein [Spiroplasma ixodetis]|nr:hypothetical protein [Spiroplasma ixodetis]
MSPIEYRLAHSKPTNNYFIPINLTLTNAMEMFSNLCNLQK